MVTERRIAFVIAAVLCGGQAATGAQPDDVAVQKPVQQLYSSDRGDAEKAEAELIAQRAALIRDLIESIKMHQAELRELHDPIRAGNRLLGIEASINVLGEMRAVEAIPILAEMISFPRVIHDDVPKELHRVWRLYSRPPGGVLHVIDSWEDDIARHPAARALVKIGEPGIPAVVEQLMGYQTIHPCLLVLVGLRGQDGAEALLTERLEKTTDEKVKKRYEITLEYLRKGMIPPSELQGGVKPH